VNCSACGWSGPAGASFCGGCGQPLTVACSGCGGSNPGVNRFCQYCGAKLSAAHETEEPAAAAPEPEPEIAVPAGERRHLTVMFCDLADSTALSERLDPEDLREVVRRYYATCTAVIEQADGYIAHYLGDGILAYFGYPAAHEDDPVVAVRAGLGIAEAIQSTDLAVRVGVHTGLAVIGEMGAGRRRQESDVVGETPNIAARLQGLAGRNQVVVSGTTRRLVEGFFVVEALGEVSLKGVSRPMAAFQVVAEKRARSRLEIAAERGLTPLVGRGREMAELLERWEQAEGGSVVLLCGEPGIGKSRLVRELGDRVATDLGLRVELRGSPHHLNTVLHPVVDLLRRILGPDPDPDAALDAMEGLADLGGVPRPEAVPVLAELVTLPYARRHPAPARSPELRKRRTLDVLSRLLAGLATGRPVFIAVEDVHWMDPTTLELVGRIVDAGPVPGLVTVMTHRPEFTPPWPDRAHVTHLTLNRLSQAQVEEVVSGLAGERPLPHGVVQTIRDRTDGVPLFVEELTQMVLESGSDQQSIPLTLRDSLMARLDRLGPAREVAQLAATIGREAPLALLQTVAPAGTALHDSLGRLVQAGIVDQWGLASDAVYVFRHALVHDAAYDSLLRSTRRRFHCAIADALEDGVGGAAAVSPEVIGHHCAAGGLTERALRAYHEAGRKAIAVSGCLEAIGHLRLALELLATLPAGPDRDRAELGLVLTLGAPLAAVQGYGAPEVEANYARAARLCESVDDPEQLFGALYGMFRVRHVRAEYDAALELGRRLERLAAATSRPALSLGAHRALGITYFYQGALKEAVAHMEAAVTERAASDVPPGDVLQELNDVADPVIVSQSTGACALWLLGRPDEAKATSARAVAAARQLGHPFTLALALYFQALLWRFIREPEASTARAAEALAYAREQEFLSWTGWSGVLHGAGLVTDGEVDAGLAAIRQGLAVWEATGSRFFTSVFLAFLAEGLAAQGRRDEALDTLEEARRFAVETGERLWLPEIHRLKGDLLAASPGTTAREAAERELVTALELARRGGAAALEQRARASLDALSGTGHTLGR
jgi:class 3 adenylate cyclase/predicted ATPase